MPNALRAAMGCGRLCIGSDAQLDHQAASYIATHHILAQERSRLITLLDTL